MQRPQHPEEEDLRIMDYIICPPEQFEDLVADADGAAVIISRGYLVDAFRCSPEDANTDDEPGVT
jgi:hypothetical protein